MEKSLLNVLLSMFPHEQNEAKNRIKCCKDGSVETMYEQQVLNTEETFTGKQLLTRLQSLAKRRLPNLF